MALTSKLSFHLVCAMKLSFNKKELLQYDQKEQGISGKDVRDKNDTKRIIFGEGFISFLSWVQIHDTLPGCQ